MKEIISTINSVTHQGPRGGNSIRVGFCIDSYVQLTQSFSPRFSDRSKYGQVFTAVTGIKPSDYCGRDPLALMVGKKCKLVLEKTQKDHLQIKQILPVPSLQLAINFESSNQ